MFTFEGPHDVFAPLTLASTVGGPDPLTNVAIAFPRNPMQLAHQAYDHRCWAQGRFTLGVGHPDPHADRKALRRFVRQSPSPGWRELVSALRAIFATWETPARALTSAASSTGTP